jgi:serine/threonine protein phosphatase PrpC
MLGTLTSFQPFRSESFSRFLAIVLQADRDFLKLADRHQLDDGSTAICVYLHDGVCYAANTGDSRCVLASNGQAVAMSSDHKPGERLDEKQRIEALGGKISFYGTWCVCCCFSLCVLFAL